MVKQFEASEQLQDPAARDEDFGKLHLAIKRTGLGSGLLAASLFPKEAKASSITAVHIQACLQDFQKQHRHDPASSGLNYIHPMWRTMLELLQSGKVSRDDRGALGGVFFGECFGANKPNISPGGVNTFFILLLLSVGYLKLCFSTIMKSHPDTFCVSDDACQKKTTRRNTQEQLI